LVVYVRDNDVSDYDALDYTHLDGSDNYDHDDCEITLSVTVLN